MLRGSLTPPAIAALLAAAALGAAACGAQEPAGGSSPSAGPPVASAAASASAPAGIDPADPAMVLPDTRPCVAPCVRQGVVFARVTSRFRKGEPAQPLALDLYRGARTPKRGAPVVVLLHGGGFVEGDRTLMRNVAEQLAGAGFLVASIQYRLVPRDRNPGSGIAADRDLVPASVEAQEDAERALRWIRRHRAELGATGDRERYAVGGFSAGAIAALRVAVRSGDRSTPRARRWRVGAAFAIAGTECGPWSPQFPCRTAYDREDAPLLMFHGQQDRTVPTEWGTRTCAAAVLEGGGCKAYFYEGVDHIWDSGTIFGGAEDLTKAQPAVIPTVAAFLRRELR